MAIKVKRRAREMDEIPLASTADIAFLLIVFFLAASALLEFRGVSIPLPQKDAPPMQVLKKDLFKVKISDKGQYLYENAAYELDDLQKMMREAAKANSELIIAVRVDPEAPVDRVPMIIKRIRDEGIVRMAVGMDRR